MNMRLETGKNNSLIEMDFAGLRRSSLLSVPAGAPGPFPLVIMLHGAGDTAAGAIKQTGWVEKAGREGFIAVFPEASRPDQESAPGFGRNPQIWNDGSGWTHAGKRDIDDIGFLRALIQKLCRERDVDGKKIFVAGFSNGASMAFRAGTELSDIVAAAAAVAGHFWLNNPRLEYPVPLIYIAGTEDPLNPFNGGEIKVPWALISKPPVEEALMKWVRLLEAPESGKVFLDSDGVKAAAYGPGRNGSEMLFYTVKGMGHVWPGGISLMSEKVAGKMSDRINATDLIWDFFENHPRK